MWYPIVVPAGTFPEGVTSLSFGSWLATTIWVVNAVLSAGKASPEIGSISTLEMSPLPAGTVVPTVPYT